MGLLQDWIRKRKEKKERETEMEQELTARHNIEQKKLSSDERELNSYVEEDRKKGIKTMLDKYRKRKMNDFWHRDVISQKNLFHKEKSILKQKDIIKQKNLFCK
jgi:mevalonate pyrophosphate decarboxylase